MALTVLAVNPGSSSLKLAVLGPSEEPVAQHEISSTEPHEVAAALDSILAESPPIDAAGHRVVHGGLRRQRPALIDGELRAELESVASYAPQHVPPALTAVDLTRERLRSVPHVACFDTAFHAGLSDAASTYAVPADWRRRWPQMRRFGFHGLSYARALQRTAQLLDRRPQDLQVVIAHLGGGCSASAVRDGTSVDTTMGFTPLEGMVMGSRSGSVDPGMLLWLLDAGIRPDELADGLQHGSGLLGLSDGLSKDTRELSAAARDGHEPAALAFDVFVRSVQRHLAAMASALDRLDALVFTGEISETHPQVREAVCAGLGVLGVGSRLADAGDEDAILSGGDSRIPVLLVRTREDLQIAAETRALLAAR